MKTLLTVALATFLVHPTFACVNRSGTTLDGHKNHYSYAALEFRHYLNRALKPEGAEMEQTLRGRTEFTNRNDYAVALIYQGRNQEAIVMLHEMEREKPNQYATAANLGTAYELAGENERALDWIREGIRRDPASHDGTEWLHMKILEAKIQQEKNPNYFKTHSVLNLDPNQIRANATSLNMADGARTISDVRQAIHYQLRERLQFVKQKDPAVASLLFDYGALEAATQTVESARQLMEMAVQFGYPVERVQPFYRQFDRAIRLARARESAFYVMIGISVIAFLVLAVKRRWIVYRRKPLSTQY